MKKLLAAAALLSVAACGGQEEPEQPQPPAHTGVEMAAFDGAPPNYTAMPAPAPAASSLSVADEGRVCRAAIASLNGRDPAIIRVISTSGDIHRVRYTRDDGTVWTNECRIGDGTAEWRAVQDGQPGRWRDEDTIRFTVDGSTINIQTFMMGEPVTNDTYTVK